MELLGLYFSLSDKAIAAIASYVDKIEKLWLGVGDVTMRGWEILSTAINNRPIPVS